MMARPVCILVVLLGAGSAKADDWPMWRYDANRSAASPQQLPEKLHLQWIREYPALEPVWEDPVNRDRMPYDSVYEPIVIGSTMLIGSNRTDTVTALDTRSGEQKWRFYADGPVRLPPVAWQQSVYFVSDDGHLYCVDTETGSLNWKVRGGPTARKVLGNGRMISAWPARGGPVIEDGTVYFAASIWPLMGVFIHAVDATSGKVVWTNDGIGSTYIDHPHGGSVSFGGVAPQGALAAVGQKLLVPGGRSVPACLDRQTGKLLYYHLSGSKMHQVDGSVDRKREGGSHVCGIGKFYFNHRGLNTAMYDLDSGEMIMMWQTTTYPVLTDDVLYLSGSSVVAYDLPGLDKFAYGVKSKKKDKKTGEPLTEMKHRWELPELWRCEVDATGALIKAGKRLYAGGEGVVSAIELSAAGEPLVVWEGRIRGSASRILAADDRLFVVTRQGQIYAFGAERTTPKTPTPKSPTPKIHRAAKAEKATPQPAAKRTFQQLLPVDKGYCLAFGLGGGRMLQSVLDNTDLRVIAVDPDERRVNRLRRRFDEAGLYGTRISVHVGDVADFEAPPYVAAMTVSEDLARAGFEQDKSFLEAIFRSMRPYGGVAWLRVEDESQRAALSDAIESARLPRAEVAQDSRYVRLTRKGPLPGSGDWTHQDGNIANTAKSDDKLVKLPLGILWFGGNTHEDILPRHGHGPSEQVIGGRLFIEGIDLLSARDVYTGQVLWKRSFPDLGTFGVYYDKSYVANPLDTTYNQVHIAGANARGTNYVATDDKLYLAVGGDCLVLDPATGETLTTFSLPTEPGAKAKPQWGYIGVYEDLLIGGSSFARFSEQYQLKHKVWDNFDTSSSRKLVVMDRHTGEVLWTRDSKYALRHNAITAGAGKLFCIDSLPEPVVASLKRRGQQINAPPELSALDVRTGEPVWSTTKDVFGTWLAYSKEHDVLLQSGRAAHDMLDGEPSKRMIAHRARDGSVLWDISGEEYGGPCMLHTDTIYLNAVSTEGAALDLLTGQPKTRQHPLTGQPMPWTYHRRYGCNSVVASEYLLSFRSGAAGYYDLATDGGTGNLGGFRSGCTSNLIAAGGVLNAPDYTRTCTCGYQNQTSLALVHMPEMETWTFNEFSAGVAGPARIRRVGINFGAPGDRRSAAGTLWLDYPSVGGPSPEIGVRLDGSPSYFRHHASRVEGPEGAWIAASGVEGALTVALRLAPDSSEMNGPSIRVKVGHKDDDAEEDPAGKVDLASSDLELTEDKSPQTVGVRFESVPIPPGSKVETAYVQFQVDEEASGATLLRISGHAADNAPRFNAQRFNVSSRKRTTATMSWKPQAWDKSGAAGSEQQTPDLAAILQEIVDREGWQQGNAVALLVSGTGKRVAEAFDGDQKGAPTLYVELADRSPPTTAREAQPTPKYTVRLHFIEPDETARPGERVFDLAIQGKTRLEGFDVLAEAGAANRSVVKEFKGIPVEEELTVTMTPAGTRQPILCGIEVLAE